MAKFILQSYQAERAEGAAEGVRVALFQKGPLPQRPFEAKSTQDALNALQEYRDDVAATGQVAAVAILHVSGRKPAGYDDALAKPAFHAVNV